MEKQGIMNLILSHSFIYCNMLFLFVLVLLLHPNLAQAAGSKVEFLPGFEGPLPFELETGYIGVGESEDVQLFYYFIKSESNPQKDPLLFWLIGGPGCSGISGIVLEIGPIKFEQAVYHGTLPKLELFPHSWTKFASIIFVDSPVGTGFSYAKTAKASVSTDLVASDHAYEFLRKWLDDNPEYTSNPLYVAGDSYGGIFVPIITQLISNGNEAGIKPHIDLKGYILGNPLTTLDAEKNYRVMFAHRIGLISDELYEVTCKGEYANVDPGNSPCLKNMQAYNEVVDSVNTAHVLEPSCPKFSPKPNRLFCPRRSIVDIFYGKLEEIDVMEVNPLQCQLTTEYENLYYWANDRRVQEALRVRKGSIGEWIRCNYSLPYTRNIRNVVPYHANLSTKGYRSLLYSGDHDMVAPYFGTQAWVRSLNYSIVDEWRKWIYQGQVAGYTRTYANKMTFATVKGAGHVAPYYKPAECKSMIEKWISYQPL